MNRLDDKWFIASNGCLHNTELPGWESKPVRRDYAWSHREITCPRELAATLRAGEFAWPGGYQMAFVTSDGALLCFDCVRAEFRNVIWSIKNKVNDGWRVVALTALFEALDGPMCCDHCNKVLLEDE